MKIFLYRFKSLILIFLCIIGIIAIILALYNRNLTEHLSQTTKNTLAEILDLQKTSFNSALTSELSTMDLLSNSLSGAPYDKKAILTAINNALERTKFENMAAVNPNGIGITDRGDPIDISNHKCFQGTLKGNTSFDFSDIPQFGQGEIAHLTVPIFKDGVVVGSLLSTYSTSKLNELLLPIFGGRGYSFIVTNTGDIIVKTKSNYTLVEDDNLLNFFDSTQIENLDTSVTIRAKMSQGESGATEYNFKNKYRYAQYEPLGIKDWYIFVMIPQDVIAADATIIKRNTIFVSLLMILAFMFFILYVLRLQIKAEKAKENYTKNLEHVAYHDDLTGLPNLAKFKMDAIKIFSENPTVDFVVAKFDIVNLKVLNEIFGFEMGNTIIQQFAQLITEIRKIKKLDIIGAIARIQGDEFILLEISGSLEEIESRRSMLENLFNERVTELLGNYRIKLRFGVYFWEQTETNINRVLEKVNLAYRIAKGNKKTLFVYYDESLKQKILNDADIEARLPDALKNEGFKVYLHPKYYLDGEYIAGAEALIRWKNTDGSIISPTNFIPLCESNGFIVKIDMYVFEQVCKLIAGWIREGYKPITVSINFSRLHLGNSHFVADILAITKRYKVPTKYLEIELTESIIFDNEEILSTLLHTLHNAGFTLAMDDFGIGYSSLGLLQKLPVDVIKIDKSFFSDIQDVPRSRIVIESIFEMAKKLKIRTVAEGVEIKEHVDLLREIGCDMVQGYYFARPMPAEDFLPPNHQPQDILRK